jgi:hypothetical protein
MSPRVTGVRHLNNHLIKPLTNLTSRHIPYKSNTITNHHYYYQSPLLPYLLTFITTSLLLASLALSLSALALAPYLLPAPAVPVRVATVPVACYPCPVALLALPHPLRCLSVCPRCSLPLSRSCRCRVSPWPLYPVLAPCPVADPLTLTYSPDRLTVSPVPHSPARPLTL